MDDYKYLKQFTSSLVRSSERPNHQSNNDEKLSHSDMEVRINVGGKKFVTRQRTLAAIPGSLLSGLDKTSEFYNTEKQEYSFDRSPSMFKEILEAHRTGELHSPRGVCPTRFKQDLEYWKIPLHLLMPCCWKHFYENTSDLDTLNNILQRRNVPDSLNAVNVTMETEQQKPMGKDLNGNISQDASVSLRYKIWLLLEEPSSSKAAKIWCLFYIFIVLLSVVNFILWLDPDLRVEPYLHSFPKPANPLQQNIIKHVYGEKVISLALYDPHPMVFGLDCMCGFIFILEAIVLLIVCPARLNLLKCPYYIIKVTVCLAMLTAFIYELKRDLIKDKNAGQAYACLKGFSVFRLLLILRIQKLYVGLQIVLLSLEKSFKELVLLIFVFIITVVIYGGMIYCVELETDSFPNLKTSLWWALITMTTVGYGDFYPTDSKGYVVAAICALQGLIVIALPIAAIASVFACYYARNSDLDTHTAAIKLDREKYAQPDYTTTNTDKTEKLQGKKTDIWTLQTL